MSQLEQWATTVGRIAARLIATGVPVDEAVRRAQRAAKWAVRA